MSIFNKTTADYGQYIKTLATLRDLRRLTGKVKDGDSVIVTASATIGDGQGGVYVWSAKSSAVDDNLKVIQPDVVIGKGRWVLAVGSDATLFSTLGLSTGSELIGYKRSPSADTINLYDRLRREIWAEDYGFSTTKTGNQNAIAFAKAIADLPANGGVINIGPGLFVVNQILLPVDPKVVDIKGSGIRATTLEMGTPNGPLIKRDGLVFSDGRITGATIGGFTIKANAASDKTNLAHCAISFTGFCKASFQDIAYIGNGLGSVGAVFEGEAKTGSTYNNVIKRIQVAGNNGGSNPVGPSRVLYTHNAGIGATGNPNLTEFRDSWIYSNIGLDLACDVHNSTRTRIDNVIFEDCSGASAIGLGQSTIVTACWFELFATNILTSPLASVDGSGSIVMGNYFSGTGTNTLGSIGRKILWIGNEGGGQSFTGVGYTKVAGSTADPAAPTITRSGGATPSNLSMVSQIVAITKDAVGVTTYSLRYSVTFTDANYIEFKINAPNGYVLENYNVGVTRTTNGRPVASSMLPDNTSFSVYIDNTDAHEINIRLTIKEL